MVRDLAAPLHADHLDPAPAQLVRVGEDVVLVGVPAEGQHGIVLEEQELVADQVVGPGFRERTLEVPRLAISDPAEPADRQRRPVLRVSVRRGGSVRLRAGVMLGRVRGNACRGPLLHARTIAGEPGPLR